MIDKNLELYKNFNHFEDELPMSHNRTFTLDINDGDKQK